MSYGQSDDYNTTQGSTGGRFDTSGERGRDAEREQFDEPQGRGQFGESDQPRAGGGEYGEQGRDTGYGQQGGVGRQAGDTSGFSQSERRAGQEGHGQSGTEGSYGQRGTEGAPAHKPGMMEKLKGEAEKFSGKKGHASDTTGQQAGGEYRQSETGGGHGASAEHKPSMMDKIKGGAEKMMSKDTGKTKQTAQEGQYEGSTGAY